MAATGREDRRKAIEAAAYEVLAEKGYAGASMLSIAKRARASNETLYNWYGDKVGLFRALITRNAEDARTLLEDGLAEDQPPLEVLEAVGPVLLRLLVSERAIALNRAAAADGSGELAAALTQAGRETVLPLVERVFARAQKDGALGTLPPREAAALYLDLLVGDMQIRRVLRALPEPADATVTVRAALAFTRLRRLLED